MCSLQERISFIINIYQHNKFIQSVISTPKNAKYIRVVGGWEGDYNIQITNFCRITTCNERRINRVHLKKNNYILAAKIVRVERNSTLQPLLTLSLPLACIHAFIITLLIVLTDKSVVINSMLLAVTDICAIVVTDFFVQTGSVKMRTIGQIL